MKWFETQLIKEAVNPANVGRYALLSAMRSQSKIPRAYSKVMLAPGVAAPSSLARVKEMGENAFFGRPVPNPRTKGLKGLLEKAKGRATDPAVRANLSEMESGAYMELLNLLKRKRSRGLPISPFGG